MKNYKQPVLLIATLLICQLCFFLPDTKAQVSQYPETYLDQRECHICGKTIQEKKVKDNIRFYDNMNMGISGFGWDYVPDSLRIQYLTIKKEILICKDCYENYKNALTQNVDEIWDEILNKIIRENKNKREFYKEQRRLDGIDELNKKIEELKQKREAMQGKK